MYFYIHLFYSRCCKYAVIYHFIHAHTCRHYACVWDKFSIWTVQCYFTINHCNLIRMVSKCEFHLLVFFFNACYIKMIPFCISCIMNTTFAPIKFYCIFTSQHIYISCNIDIQLINATQQRSNS